MRGGSRRPTPTARTIGACANAVAAAIFSTRSAPRSERAAGLAAEAARARWHCLAAPSFTAPCISTPKRRVPIDGHSVRVLSARSAAPRTHPQRLLLPRNPAPTIRLVRLVDLRLTAALERERQLLPRPSASVRLEALESLLRCRNINRSVREGPSRHALRPCLRHVEPR